MVPYLTLPDLPILGIHPFTYCVLAGVLCGYLVASRRARQYAVDRKTFYTFVASTVIPGLICCDLLEPFLYHPRNLQKDPSLLFVFFDRYSSFAGLIGFGLGFLVYVKWRRPTVHWLILADVAMQGGIVAWIFGRLGCATAHDHPGKLTTFFLGVRFPEGARHDLGFYEFLFALFVALPIALYIHRSRAYAGTQLAVLALLYGTFRLFGDSLRVNEYRFGYWTAGQICALGLLLIGYLTAAIVKKQQIPSPRTAD